MAHRFSTISLSTLATSTNVERRLYTTDQQLADGVSAIRRPQWSVKCDRLYGARPTYNRSHFTRSLTLDDCWEFRFQFTVCYMLILQLWRNIKNPTPSMDTYLVDKQSCQISSRSYLKQQSLRCFKDGHPNKNKDKKHKNKMSYCSKCPSDMGI